MSAPPENRPVRGGSASGIARALLVALVALSVAGGGCTRASLADLSSASPADEGTFTLSGVRPGARFARGSVHPIRWTYPPSVPLEVSVAVFESTDRGASYRALGYASTDERYYRWRVPDADRARLRVQFERLDHDRSVRWVETADVELSPSGEKPYRWTEVARDAPFGPRDGAGGVVHRGRMWLLGGWNPSRFPLQSANDVWSSEDGATWILEKPNTFWDRTTFDRTKDWEGRHFAGYQTFAGKMWIVGGDANLGSYQTDVWCSDDGKTWTRTDIHTVTPRTDPATGAAYPQEVWPAVEESQFGMRTAHVTGTLGDRLFVIGGQRVSTMVPAAWPGKPAAALSDVFTTVDGASFVELPDGPRFPGRGFVSEAPTLAGRLWLVGGGLHDDPAEGKPERVLFNDVYSSADGIAWEPSPDEPPFSPRMWHDVKAFDDRLWVVNGWDGPSPTNGREGDNLRDVWYSSDGANWYDASPPADRFVRRHAGTAWVHRGALFVGSGNAIDTTWHADVWRLDPVAPGR